MLSDIYWDVDSYLKQRTESNMSWSFATRNVKSKIKPTTTAVYNFWR